MNIREILKQIDDSVNHMEKLELLNDLMTKANSMIQKISEIEKDYIIDRLSDNNLEVRICSNCGKFMDVGYVVNGGEEYYCNDKCLHEEVGEEEWKKLTAYLIDEEDRTEEEDEWVNEYGITDSYWTEWN